MKIEFEPNQLIDNRYQIIEKLDEGGMGAVWKATDSRTNDSVVVLKFPLKYHDPEILERFAQEAGTMRELAGDCDNILDIQDIGSVKVNDIDNVPYYVMRFQTGGALRDWQAPKDDQGRPIFTRESLSWVTGVATALDFLHHQPEAVFHRDVKPENILFNASGAPKLSDFGIVKNIKKATTTITQIGAALGTVAYMPPEIWRGGNFLPASDQFSFVATVYEMISGKRPYEGETPFAMLESISRGHQKLNETIGLSTAASNALDKGLAREPGDRFDSCNAFASAFFAGLPSKEELENNPSEMPLGFVSAVGSDLGGRVGVVSGTPKAPLPLVVDGPRSDGKLFQESPVALSPVAPVAPSVVLPKPALFGAGALLLMGLLGSLLYLSGDFPEATPDPDQQLALTPNTSSPASPSTKVSSAKTSKPILASIVLAENLYNGTGGEIIDRTRAVSMFEELAEKGNPDAQTFLGDGYLYGKDFEVDEKEAVKWFRKAAVQGHSISQVSLGFAYQNGQGVEKDEQEAVKWFRKAAEQEDLDGQAALGFAYQNGLGVDEDQQEAVRWLHSAAAEGHSAAQYNLGSVYLSGQGVEKDEQEAVKWLRKSAEQGDLYGQTELGVAYQNGLGVDEDQQEAVKWFRKAAGGGQAVAQVNLGIAYLSGVGVEKDAEEGVKWLRKAAEQGDLFGQTQLGVAYQNGLGIEKDEQEAVKWFRQAADQGDAAAQAGLGEAYQHGLGVGQDQQEAVKWYRKAAEQGHPNGQNGLGYAYMTGSGVNKDLSQGIKWFRNAADQGYYTAQFSLGNIYLNGDGVARDETKAVEYFRKAAAQGFEPAITALRNLGR